MRARRVFPSAPAPDDPPQDLCHRTATLHPRPPLPPVPTLTLGGTVATITIEPPNVAPLLWGFPSKGVDESKVTNGVCTLAKPLRDAKIAAPDIDAFGSDLTRADFEKVGQQSWRTIAAGRSDGVSATFDHTMNVDALVLAIHRMIARVEKYPSRVPATPAATAVA